ncbi:MULTISPECIES: hypothetical protein [unclassified Methanosarcina]|uniref:hypothetical protein n=1 Tax=unclassified Methanosarcina TaxID=2644672 RepID=UPI000B2F694D|nr:MULTISPECIES: hypothetical protein [unclassified Methanosarcina]
MGFEKGNTNQEKNIREKQSRKKQSRKKQSREISSKEKYQSRTKPMEIKTSPESRGSP